MRLTVNIHKKRLRRRAYGDVACPLGILQFIGQRFRLTFLKQGQYFRWQ